MHKKTFCDTYQQAYRLLYAWKITPQYRKKLKSLPFDSGGVLLTTSRGRLHYTHGNLKYRKIVLVFKNILGL